MVGKKKKNIIYILEISTVSIRRLGSTTSYNLSQRRYHTYSIYMLKKTKILKKTNIPVLISKMFEEGGFREIENLERSLRI